MDVDEKEDKELEVYLPGKALGKDEVLEADQSAYEMLHKLNVEWPCLSFDVLQDRLGDDRKTVSSKLPENNAGVFRHVDLTKHQLFLVSSHRLYCRRYLSAKRQRK
jgi:hypothetical protein